MSVKIHAPHQNVSGRETLSGQLEVKLDCDVKQTGFLSSRNSQGDLDISGEVLVNTDIHVDVGWALRALMTLANFSVDVSSLAINGQ